MSQRRRTGRVCRLWGKRWRRGFVTASSSHGASASWRPGSAQRSEGLSDGLGAVADRSWWGRWGRAGSTSCVSMGVFPKQHPSVAALRRRRLWPVQGLGWFSYSKIGSHAPTHRNQVNNEGGRRCMAVDTLNFATRGRATWPNSSQTTGTPGSSWTAPGRHLGPLGLNFSQHGPTTRPSRRKDCRQSIFAFGSRLALQCRGS